MNKPISATDAQQRAFWLRQLHQWHWFSSALCLIAMCLFAVTGITLNHAAQIEAKPQVTHKAVQLSDAMRKQVQDSPKQLPPAVKAWLEQELSVVLKDKVGEWSAQEAYFALPRPGGDAWLRLDLDSGEVEYELTERGWIATLNDLHKGRNTGQVWSWFIDIFAGLCLIFCLTGLLLLKMHATNRPSTWPAVAFGLVLPLLLAITFIH